MKLLRDTWLIFQRNLVAILRNPVWVIIGLIQPILYLGLFAPLLDGIAKSPGFPPGGALTVFLPGLLIQLALFGAAFVGFGLIPELRSGLIERMRVTPVSRLALFLGRAGRDIVTLLVQAIVLVVVAIPFGLEVDLPGFLITLGLLILIGLVMTSFSYATALALKSEDALAPVLNTVVLPTMLLSGVLLPMTLAPRWLRILSSINPLKHAVDATRALFTGHLSDPSVTRGLGIMAILTILAVWWAVQSFRQATA
ncbi:MAG: ABC transporter permease [Thermomicrobiales bacterium]